MHRKIGIFGENPLSTIRYYQHIVKRYQELYGNHDYPDTIIYGEGFQKYEDWMKNGDWDKIGDGILNGLKILHNAGADFAIIPSNSWHILLDRLNIDTPIPILSIIDATADAVKTMGLKKVGLIGNKFIMEKKFYSEGLEKSGLKVFLPEKTEQEYIHRIINEELSSGIFAKNSQREYLDIINNLSKRGAQAVIIGCTVIPHLVLQENTSVNLLDTSSIHAEKALQYAVNS